jgi:predicted deacylase
MNPPALLSMTAPLREDFQIAYHDIGGADAAPTLALIAGIHGDELNGVFVLSRLAHFLGRVAGGRQPGQRLNGRVIIVPAVNVLGVNTRNRRWPFDGTDINRMFPGYNAGETTQRIAHAVLELTRPARYRVDIHSSNLDFEELPQVRLYEPNDGERGTARLFGLPAVIERPMNTIFTSTIGHAWRACGGQNFVIQAGQAGVVQPAHCDRLFRALVAFLWRTGLLTGVALSEEDEEGQYFGVGHTMPLISEHAGLFISRFDVGRWVQAGDIIGQVYDGFDGELRHEIKTPVAGLLSGIRRQPLLFEGDLLARIQTRQAVAEGVDTYLHGQGQ